MNTHLLVSLKRKISNAFNLSELRVICFELDISYENLKGNHEEKILELVELFNRKDEINKLIEKCKSHRPSIDWTFNNNNLKENWISPSLTWPDGTIMQVLPFMTRRGYLLCIGKHPISNRQYRKFVEATGYKEPAGQNFDGDSRSWLGGFKPWEDEDYSDPDKPVVCVDYSDAKRYCMFVDNLSNSKFKTRLPTAYEWDLAAFRKPAEDLYKGEWLNICKVVHHMRLNPAAIDKTGSRCNQFGIADLVGNVWEWCKGIDNYDFITPAIGRPAVAAVIGGWTERISLRGGSFLDNLKNTLVHLRVTDLQDGSQTQHSDLGFRLASEVTIDSISIDDSLLMQLEDISLKPGLYENAHVTVGSPNVILSAEMKIQKRDYRLK